VKQSQKSPLASAQGQQLNQSCSQQANQNQSHQLNQSSTQQANQALVTQIIQQSNQQPEFLTSLLQAHADMINRLGDTITKLSHIQKNIFNQQSDI